MEERPPPPRENPLADEFDDDPVMAGEKLASEVAASREALRMLAHDGSEGLQQIGTDAGPSPDAVRAQLGTVATGLAHQLSSITGEMNKIRQELYGDNGIGGIAKELEKLKEGNLSGLLGGGAELDGALGSTLGDLGKMSGMANGHGMGGAASGSNRLASALGGGSREAEGARRGGALGGLGGLGQPRGGLPSGLGAGRGEEGLDFGRSPLGGRSKEKLLERLGDKAAGRGAGLQGGLGAVGGAEDQRRQRMRDLLADVKKGKDAQPDGARRRGGGRSAEDEDAQLEELRRLMSEDRGKERGRKSKPASSTAFWEKMGLLLLLLIIIYVVVGVASSISGKESDHDGGDDGFYF